MSEEFPFANDWSKKLMEAMTQGFIYTVGEYVDGSYCDFDQRILDVLFTEMASGISDDPCDCHRETSLDWSDGRSLTWSEFNQKISTELCDLFHTGFRILIRDTLPKIEFPEEGVLDKLKEKLPVLFAD